MLLLYISLFLSFYISHKRDMLDNMPVMTWHHSTKQNRSKGYIETSTYSWNSHVWCIHSNGTHFITIESMSNIFYGCITMVITHAMHDNLLKVPEAFWGVLFCNWIIILIPEWYISLITAQQQPLQTFGISMRIEQAFFLTAK